MRLPGEQVHLEICQKITVNSAQRQPWDSQRVRLNASGKFSGASPAPQRGPSAASSSRRGVLASRNGTASRGGGGFGGGGGLGGGDEGGSERGWPGSRALNTPGTNAMPANKMPKWKRDHQAFQQALQANRQISQATANGVPLSDLPPPPPTNSDLDDRVPCPHCGRKFNAKAAERHIPK